MTLELFDFGALLGDELSDLIEVVNRSGLLGDFVGDDLKLGSKSVVLAFGQLRDSRNFALGDVAVLLGVHVSDVVALDFKHRDIDRFRNFPQQLFFKFTITLDVLGILGSIPLFVVFKLVNFFEIVID